LARAESVAAESVIEGVGNVRRYSLALGAAMLYANAAQ